MDRWLEVASVSLITDFQARRGGIRFRREGGGTPLVHSLNGSGLATPRVWAALLEHGQQPDGTVRLPPALVPYVGTDFIGADRRVYADVGRTRACLVHLLFSPSRGEAVMWPAWACRKRRNAPAWCFCIT